MGDFFQHYTEMFVAAMAYMEALPLWVRIWMDIMSVVLLLSILWSFFRVEARWVLLSLAGTMVLTPVWHMMVGINGLWGVMHIVFWTPLVVYLYRRLPGIAWSSLYGLWVRAAILVMGISLIFDFKDAAEYLLA